MFELRRLRQDNVIVGYSKKMGSYTFFSKDLYGWNGKKILFNQKDYATEFKDKHNRVLFEEDLITHADYPNRYFLINYDSILNKFYLVDYKSSSIFDEDIYLVIKDKNKVDRVAFSFHQEIL